MKFGLVLVATFKLKYFYKIKLIFVDLSIVTTIILTILLNCIKDNWSRGSQDKNEDSESFVADIISVFKMVNNKKYNKTKHEGNKLDYFTPNFLHSLHELVSELNNFSGSLNVKSLLNENNCILVRYSFSVPCFK